MSTTPSKLDRSSILRYAWFRARAAAAAAGESVCLHIGAAMRTAWAEAKAAAAVAAAAPVVSPRDALVARIARNDQAMDEIQAGIDRNYAVLGSSGIIEYQYETLNGLHVHGLNLRDDLKELDAAAAAEMATAMVPQLCQQQQANAGTPAAGACEVCGRPLTDPISIEAGIGPVCRAAGHQRRQLGLFDNPSDYRIELAGDVICVTDLDRGGRTVTNDAAGVVEDLRRLGYDLDRMPVIYKDSTGRWDELVVKDRRFAGFQAINSDRQEVLRAIAKGLDVPPPEMVSQPCQHQQACAGDAALTARRAAVVAAGMVVEPHPRRSGWKVGFGEVLTGEKASCTTVNTEEQAVGMAEEMLADFRGQQPAPAQEPVEASAPVATAAAEPVASDAGYEFDGTVYDSARGCYFAMMDFEEKRLVSRGSAFTYADGLFATEVGTGAELSINEMSDRFCDEGGSPLPGGDVAPAVPDLSTEEGLAAVLAGREAILQLQGGEAVYRIVDVRRWSSPDGSRVRDYLMLMSEGMASDDRKGPVSLFIERAGGGRGTYLDTAVGRVWWGYGGFCDSGTKRGRADDLVKELLAPLASSEGSL